MKLAIMQPYLFPYIGYFQLIKAVDKFVIYDDVNYINKGWINRNNILVNGESKLFTAPLKNASQNRLIMDIQLGDDPYWKLKFLKTIQMNYSKAPYYQEAYSLVEEGIYLSSRSISYFNLNIIKRICSYCNIQTQIESSSSIYDNTHLSGQERILDICKKENSSMYINPSGGTELYSEEAFMKNNIELRFLTAVPLSYKQFSSVFIANLSVIDVIMFNSREEIENILGSFILK